MDSAFCPHCRNNVAYRLGYNSEKLTVNGETGVYLVVAAKCNKCNGELAIPGLIDANSARIDDQYRLHHGLATIDEIKKLSKIYNLGKSTLSLALGFGEITITRYLEGQYPSKKYSDIIRKALYSPEYMRQLLNENKNKITETAYKKANEAINRMLALKVVSDRMLSVIAYMFELATEITPLMLQKLLYYVQGISLVVKSEPMFPEECQAWVHGPVYPEIWELFSDFKYQPILDDRFVIFQDDNNNLSDDDRKIISLVVDSFGMYSGKTLEMLTHKEEPWITARRDYDDGIPSNESISNENIKAYFTCLDNKYNFHSKAGILRYINESLSMNDLLINKA